MALRFLLMLPLVAFASASAALDTAEPHVLAATALGPDAAKAGGYHETVDDTPIDPKMCHAAEASEQLDLSGFCEGGTCWPALWLLGAQKAATSAVYEVLEQCGTVVGAWPSKEMTGTVVPPFCEQPCKETHFFTDPFTWGGGHNGEFRIAKNVTEFPHGIMPESRAQAFTSLYRSGAHCSQRSYQFMPERAKAACEGARFIEATPSTDYPGMPKLLAATMPPHLIKKARFVIIMREPVERTLSWYNHNRCPSEAASGAPWDPCADPKTAKTFDDFITCREETHPFVAQGDAGNYGQFLDNLLESDVSRRQVLVLNYADAFKNATSVQQTMAAITRHYGGPVLDRVLSVPPSNSKDYAGKIEQITCSARERLSKLYQPMNDELYERLAAGYKTNQAPTYEPRFAHFELKLPCGANEKSMADMH